MTKLSEENMQNGDVCEKRDMRIKTDAEMMLMSWMNLQRLM